MLPRGDFTPPSIEDGWTTLQVDLEYADARSYVGVTAERLRQWVARGNVERGTQPRTVDMGSLLGYLWQRQQNGEPTCQP